MGPGVGKGVRLPWPRQGHLVPQNCTCSPTQKLFEPCPFHFLEREALLQRRDGLNHRSLGTDTTSSPSPLPPEVRRWGGNFQSWLPWPPAPGSGTFQKAPHSHNKRNLYGSPHWKFQRFKDRNRTKTKQVIFYYKSQNLRHRHGERPK